MNHDLPLQSNSRKRELKKQIQDLIGQVDQENVDNKEPQKA